MYKIDMPKLISKELENVTSHGLNWSLVDGGKHCKLFVCGHLVGVLSRGNNSGGDMRSVKNLRSSIRRIARDHANQIGP